MCHGHRNITTIDGDEEGGGGGGGGWDGMGCALARWNMISCLCCFDVARAALRTKSSVSFCPCYPNPAQPDRVHPHHNLTIPVEPSDDRLFALPGAAFHIRGNLPSATRLRLAALIHCGTRVRGHHTLAPQRQHNKDTLFCKKTK